MKKWKYIGLLIILAFIFVLILILNMNTEFVTDDFIYQFVFENRYPTNSTRWLSSPLDLFGSMFNHWKLWGGRIPVHFLLQFAFLLGKPFFNVFNSIMFLVFGYLIYKHINNKSLNIPVLVLIYTVVFLFVPQPGSTIFWKSGSANYLWSSVFLLSMTLIYKKEFDKKGTIKNNKLYAFLLFIFGIFAGWLNENSGCALIVLLILFIVYYKYKNNIIPKWSVSGLIGSIIGYILLLSSPGNFIRAREMYPMTSYNSKTIIDGLFRLTRLSCLYIFPIIIVTIVTCCLIFSKKKNIKMYINQYGIQFAFIVFSIISIYSLVLSPASPERCWMFAFTYLLIVSGLNIYYLMNDKKYGQLINKIIIALMVILSIKSISVYNEAYYDIVDTKALVDDHARQIKVQLNKNIKDVTVHSVSVTESKYNAFTFNGYLTTSSSSWTNRWIAKYYGAKSIAAK